MEEKPRRNKYIFGANTKIINLYTTLQLFHKKISYRAFWCIMSLLQNITKESDPVRKRHYTTKRLWLLDLSEWTLLCKYYALHTCMEEWQDEIHSAVFVLVPMEYWNKLLWAENLLVTLQLYGTKPQGYLNFIIKALKQLIRQQVY